MSLPRCGIGVPNDAEFGDVNKLVTLAVEAEAAGWDGFFLWDHLLRRPPWGPLADPWIVLAAVAVSTERLVIGPMITPVPRRRPSKLARETVSLDHLAGGRTVFGVGLGAPDGEFSRFGEDPDARVRAAKLDEGLEVLAGLWSGEPFSHAGEHYAIDDVTFLPRPLQQPRIPVWVGGRWPAKPPMRRAARWDGIVPTHVDVAHGEMMTPEQLAEVMAYVDDHRPDPTAPFDVAIQGISPSEDPARAADLVAGYDRLTWWVESLDRPAGSYDAMRERVNHGPPRP